MCLFWARMNPFYYIEQLREVGIPIHVTGSCILSSGFQHWAYLTLIVCSVALLTCRPTRMGKVSRNLSFPRVPVDSGSSWLHFPKFHYYAGYRSPFNLMAPPFWMSELVAFESFLVLSGNFETSSGSQWHSSSWKSELNLVVLLSCLVLLINFTYLNMFYF